MEKTEIEIIQYDIKKLKLMSMIELIASIILAIFVFGIIYFWNKIQRLNQLSGYLLKQAKKDISQKHFIKN